ncbi:MAG: glycoside hydrolase family 3 C-terminal domain-containing protein [Bacteroidales bacterium]|nr:glycoside hydrolase family 3 C-terminal domain-containing protein [Bacteroidales bacterium]
MRGFVQTAVALSALLAVACSEQEARERRIDRLVSSMTLEEKIGMLHANRMFSSGGVSRLGIPDLWFSDGPHGVRMESEDNGWKPLDWDNDACSYLPALSALAATWDSGLAYRYGTVIGAECKARGKDVCLAPGVNIVRSVQNGRTWEYFSEDPFITSEMAVPYIRGIQSCGVASCVKHFALNSQAWHQYTISSEVDDRTLHEIYLPAFEAAVKRAGVMAVIPAYNKVRGRWCSENTWLIDTLLRRDMGFDGLVVSDWNGVHSTLGAARCGTDIEMGTAVKKDGKYDFDQYYLAAPLLEKVRSGEVSPSCVDDKVRNILRLMLRLDLVGKAPYDTAGMASRLATREHAAVAREVARKSIVLLKNDAGFLPLDRSGYRRIAVVGACAAERFALGGGSPKVKAKYEVTALEGIRSRVGAGTEVVFAPGFRLRNRAFQPAVHRFTTEFDVEDSRLVEAAVEAARQADLVLYIGGLTHEHGLDCEGFDRADMKLPYRQDALISAVLDANPNTVVVLMTGSPVELGGWERRAPAILQCSFLGMEGGNALAEVLFGDVCPEGKLTVTWARSLSDMPDHAVGEYPGSEQSVRFNEGVMVGYRWFDTYQAEPRYEFGYGLSYTTFRYGSLRLAPVWKKGRRSFKVSFDVTNTGPVDGCETVQLYVRDRECRVERPDRELKGFCKVRLRRGRTKRVTLTLDRRALQWYDADSSSWVDEPGRFDVLVGASSRDIRLEGSFSLE